MKETMLNNQLDVELGKEGLYFDSDREIKYLETINDNYRFVALKNELETAMQEIFWVRSGGLDRVLENGRLKDTSTNSYIDQYVWNGGNKKEISAFEKIQKSLSEGSRLVVHFSPANLDLGYGDNLVDFWINDLERQKIKYLRIFVNDGFDILSNIYKEISGENVNSEKEMLEKPLVIWDNSTKMADIQQKLRLSDKKINITNDRVEEVCGSILDDFYGKFGNRIFEKSDLIDRIYSGIYETLFEKGDKSDELVDLFLRKRIDTYMYSQIAGMRIRTMSGSCPGLNKTIDFGSGEVPIVSKVNGELIFTKGSKEGLKECKTCGYWYAGDSCPLCK